MPYMVQDTCGLDGEEEADGVEVLCNNAEQPARHDAGAGISCHAEERAPYVGSMHKVSGSTQHNACDSTGKTDSSCASSWDLVVPLNFGTRGSEQGEIHACSQPENVLDGHPQHSIPADWDASHRDRAWRPSRRSSTTGKLTCEEFVSEGDIRSNGQAGWSCVYVLLPTIGGSMFRADQKRWPGGQLPWNIPAACFTRIEPCM